MIADGLWTNQWDVENRTIATGNASGIPTNGWSRETWTYLPDGRWIERIIYSWNPSTLNYQPSTTNRFLWDGKVLFAVLDHANGLIMSFMRGLDLSGTMQGAGSVGGLLAINFRTNGTQFVANDGNGNVAALVKGSVLEL